MRFDDFGPLCPRGVQSGILAAMSDDGLGPISTCNSRSISRANAQVPSWMTAQQVADFLAVTDRTVRRLVQRRRLRAYRLGRQLRFRRADVDALFTPVTIDEAGVDLDAFIRQGSA
jgi:excisionase family DNA binding protein